MKNTLETNYQEQLKQMEIAWGTNPALQSAYKDFFNKIASYLNSNDSYPDIEIGCGIGKILEVLPNCILTDIEQTSYCMEIQNAYSLSYPSASINTIICIDVLHHLKYPAKALEEFHRTLRPKGRVIILEPCLSLFSLFVYGLFHDEPLGLWTKVNWDLPAPHTPPAMEYFAAQASCSKIFGSKKYLKLIKKKWHIIALDRFSALRYLLSGGFSKRMWIPFDSILPLKNIEGVIDLFPKFLVASRMIVVLEKKDTNDPKV